MYDESKLLTSTERKALGLPPMKDEKRDRNGQYRFVLVEFDNGFKQLIGMYPRKKNPESLLPAVATARSRYLLFLSGGRFIDAAKAKLLPKIANARAVTEVKELKELRYKCAAMRSDLESNLVFSIWRRL